jgi:ribonuclease HI
MKAKIYFDGGCSPNPGKMSCAVVIVYPDGSKSHSEIKDLGQGTNNIAEWSGFIHALQLCHELSITDADIIGDSKLVVMQANGLWRVKDPTLQILHAEAKEMRQGLTLKINHVLRAYNLAGTYLESGNY